MPSDWPEVHLEDVASEVTVGFVGPMASEYLEEGVPFLRSLNIEPLRIKRSDLRYISDEFHKRICKSRLTPGDVVIVRTGKPGACAVVPEWLPEANCSDLVVVRPGPGLDASFLSYYVNSAAKGHIAAHLVGAVQQHFNVGSAKKLLIRLPPLPEQLAIAGVLGSLDDKIELNRRMNRTLESMARALFKSWFVDFDPVHANAAGKPSLPPDLAGHFPAAFAPSLLGNIPKGWEVKPIGELCEINARTLRKKDKLDRLEYVEISAASGGDIESMPTYNRADAPGRARRRLRHGDVAVSTVRPDRGAYFLALNPPAHRIASTGFAVMSPKVPFSFLFVLMTRPEMSEKLGQLADGAAYPAVKPEQIEAIEAVVTADSAILEAFHAAVEPLLERMEQNRQESRTLAALRDALLPKLLGGTVPLEDAMTTSARSPSNSKGVR